MKPYEKVRDDHRLRVAAEKHPLQSQVGMASTLVRPHSRPGAARISLGRTFPRTTTPTMGSNPIAANPLGISSQPAGGDRPIMMPVRQRLASPSRATHLPDRGSPSPREKSPPRHIGSAWIHPNIVPSPSVMHRLDDSSVSVIPLLSPGNLSRTSGNGEAVGDLIPEFVTALDLKKFDLESTLPNEHRSDNLQTPRFKFTSTRVIDCDENSGRIVSRGFVANVVTCKDVGLDRSLQYHVFPELFSLFTERPEIDADTGDLTFTLAPNVSGSTKCWVRLADNASVSANGECKGSDPQAFEVRVHSRSSAKIRGTVDWCSFSHKCSAELTEVPAMPQVEHGALGVPCSNPHALRYTTVRHEVIEHCAPPVAQSSDDGFPEVASVISEITSPWFLSPLADIERMRMGLMYLDRGSFRLEQVAGDALEATEKRIVDAIAEAERSHGVNHPDLCPYLDQLSRICIAAGAKRHGDALEILERIARIRCRHAGLSSFEDTILQKQETDEEMVKKLEYLCESLSTLSLFLKILGRYAEAVEFALHARRFASHAAGRDSPLYVRFCYQLGECLCLHGEYHTAITVWNECVSISEVVFGLDAYATVDIVHSLGMACTEVGNHESAIALHKRALNVVQGAGQMRGTVPLRSLTYLAIALWHAEDADAAEKCVADALHGIREFEEDATVDRVIHQCSMLSVLASTSLARKNSSGFRLLERALTQCASACGIHSIETAVLTAEMGAAWLQFGNWKRAKGDLRAAAAVFCSSLGPLHPYAARVNVLLSQCELLEDCARAQALIEHARSALVSVLHETHQDLAVVAAVSCQLHMEMRDGDHAVKYAKQSWEILKNGIHKGRLYRLESLICGAFMLAKLPIPTDVLLSLEARVHSAVQQLGETSDSLIEPLQNLAEGYYSQREFAKAHHAFSRALKIADSVNLLFLLGNLFKPAAFLSPSERQERNRLVMDRLSPLGAVQFAGILYSIAAVDEAEGKLEDAQATSLQALAGIEIANRPDSVAACEVLLQLSRILHRDGHFGDSLAHAERSYNTLLEFHATATPLVREVFSEIHLIQEELQRAGYTLVRHSETRHRCAIYL